VIAARDLSALTSISGIGRKIAERLLLELRDKLPVGSPSPASPPGTGAQGVRSAGDDEERLRTALTGMGFRPAEADRAIATLGERVHGPLPELLREALALLAK
jgi:Holliday junction DNA helicase RuvA